MKLAGDASRYSFRHFVSSAAEPKRDSLAVARQWAKVTRCAAGYDDLQTCAWCVCRYARLAKLFIVKRSQQRDQMAAGRIAEPADSRGVDFQFAGMGPHPAHGRLAVVNLCRELVRRREPIVDRHGRVAVLGQSVCKRREIGPRAHPPRAAVNDQHAGKRSLTRAGDTRRRPAAPNLARRKPGYAERRPSAPRPGKCRPAEKQCAAKNHEFQCVHAFASMARVLVPRPRTPIIRIIEMNRARA